MEGKTTSDKLENSIMLWKKSFFFQNKRLENGLNWHRWIFYFNTTSLEYGLNVFSSYSSRSFKVLTDINISVSASFIYIKMLKISFL